MASRAVLWYNEATKIVVLGGACDTPSRIHLEGDVSMSTLPHSAQKGNPQLYTVYALTDQLEHITWKNVRYIGLSINIAYRFQQHLSCSDTSNEDKNEWIQSVLAQGRIPLLHKIEEKIPSIEQGRAREQHWIRYAMSQGAKLLNRAITYTEQERMEVHKRRAIRYAQVAEILAQGTYVKRWYGDWYPPRLLTRYSVPIDQHISLLDTREIGFKTQGNKLVSIDNASDEEFDAFIRQYIPIIPCESDEWGLEERRDVIEYAQAWGKELEFYEMPKPVKKSKRHKK